MKQLRIILERFCISLFIMLALQSSWNTTLVKFGVKELSLFESLGFFGFFIFIYVLFFVISTAWYAGRPYYVIETKQNIKDDAYDSKK